MAEVSYFILLGESPMNLPDNPFHKNFVAEPWESIIDVPEIYADIHQNILNILEKIKQDKQCRNVLLLAEPGQGKTHLINKICKDLLSKGSFSCFHPHSTFHSFSEQALKQIMESLLKIPSGNSHSQLDIMTCYILIFFLGNENLPLEISENPMSVVSFLKDKGVSINTLIYKAGDWFRNNQLQFNEEMLEVLFNRMFRDEEYRWNANKWLKGLDLTEEKMKILGISSSLKENPLEGIISLGAFSSVHHPIFLAIDQIDVINSDPKAITALGELIVAIRHQASNVLIFVSCLSRTWLGKFGDLLESIKDRIKENRLNLPKLTQKEREMIILKRLELIRDYKPNNADIWWPFSYSEAQSYIQDSVCDKPRALLRKFSDKYKNLQIEKVPEKVPKDYGKQEDELNEKESPKAEEYFVDEIDRKFLEYRKKYQESESDIPFDSDMFSNYFYHFLTSYSSQKTQINNFCIEQVESFPLRKTPVIKIVSNKAYFVLAFVSTSNNRSIAASFSNIDAYKKENPSHRVFIIRDMLSGEISKNAVKATSLLRSLREKSCQLVMVTRPDYFTIRSLWSVLSRIESQEICEDGRVLGKDDFNKYLFNKRCIGNLEIFKKIFPPQSQSQTQNDSELKTTKDQKPSSVFNFIKSRHLVPIAEIQKKFSLTDQDVISTVNQYEEIRLLPNNENFLQFFPGGQSETH